MAYSIVRMKKSQQKNQNVRFQATTKKESIIFEDGDDYIIEEPPLTQTMKRYSTSSYSESPMKAVKLGKQISLQTITTSAGTQLTTYDGKVYNLQGGGGNGGKQQQIIRTSDGTSLRFKPGTAIKLSNSPTNKQYAIPIMQSNGLRNSAAPVNTQTQQRRPTIFIKSPAPKKTIRSVTLELIEKSPFTHLGLASERLNILKTVVCSRTNISLVDLYITLKKIRLNEDFTLLGEYFEHTEAEVQKIFTRTIVKLAKYMKCLIQWPESKKYYDRHKNLPIAFRSKLSYVQSLIECVETEVQRPQISNLDTNYCTNYKFILTLSPSGVISYVSDAYVGNNDDLTIFNASNFRNVIPKYLSLVADPGKGIRRKRKPHDTTDPDSDSTTDSAEETEDDDSGGSNELRTLKTSLTTPLTSATHKSLNVVNSELTSRKVKNFSIPTVRVREPVCRLQIRHSIYCLREFKILQPYSVLDPLLYQHINEILVIVSALTNLQR